MSHLQKHPVVKPHAAHGITALFDALRQQAHGLSLGLFRVRNNRLRLPDIDVKAMRGHANVAHRYQALDPDAACRVLIVDNRGELHGLKLL